ncbi:MAG: glutathione S-transferase N-terminal domain-containing protein [Alphaproteobacteria bacterium]|nr:glutathione S-transferase N-terminal domain-containing protein [Alphaproteobacteria bacterium]
MKLRFSPTSPFVRKVTVTLHETGQADGVELITTNVWDPATDIARDNPVGKVPALVADDGTVYVESDMICAYLDSQHDGPKLIPAEGPARWRVLRLQALADGILDSAVDRVKETRRPEDKQWDGMHQRRRVGTGRTLDLLESEAGALGGGADAGTIALGCALGYLDLRFPDEAWRGGRPKLAAWYETFSARPSMRVSEPRQP